MDTWHGWTSCTRFSLSEAKYCITKCSRGTESGFLFLDHDQTNRLGPKEGSMVDELFSGGVAETAPNAARSTRGAESAGAMEACCRNNFNGGPGKARLESVDA